MKKNKAVGKIETKSIARAAIVTLLLLSIPFTAMLFDWQVIDPGSPALEEVNWSLLDFMVMGVLIFSTITAYELLAKKVQTGKERLVVAAVLALLFLLIWAELAVGILGTPFGGS